MFNPLTVVVLLLTAFHGLLANCLAAGCSLVGSLTAYSQSLQTSGTILLQEVWSLPSGSSWSPLHLSQSQAPRLVCLELSITHEVVDTI